MRSITIKSDRVGRYDDVSPFLLERGDLELKIELPEKSGEFYFAFELNGKIGKPIYIPRGGTIVVGELSAGELRAEVKHYLRGTLLEVYKVEPLLLKAVERKLSATPEIALLTDEIAFLTGEIEALKKETEALKKSLTEALKKETEALKESLTEERENARKAVRELVLSFLSYAYAEYVFDVQLNARSLSAEEFARALGYELSKEELEEIKNKKEIF